MFDYLGMAYTDYDYTVVITTVHWLKCIICCWNSLDVGAMSALAFPSATIAQVRLASTFVVTTALRKKPWTLWLHCHQCCCAL